MKFHYVVMTFLALFLTRPIEGHAAVNLPEAYQSALKKNESVAVRIEDVVQAEEKLTQAKGGILPTISAVGIHQLQETPPSGASTSSPSEQQTAKIMATQPLFRGLREFAGMRMTKRLLEAERESLEDAKALLYAEVADAFYTILFLEKEIRNLTNQKELMEKRLKELRQRIGIGRSRRSEGYSLDSSVGNNEAQLLDRRTQLKAARESFTLITGLENKTVLAEPADSEAKLPTLEAYLSKIEKRADVKAARATVESASESVSVAKGAHLPSLDLNGNYYLKRPGSLQDVHWDVQLVLTVPLFSGGITQSQVREASSQLTQAELTENLVKRTAEQQIRTLYDGAVSSLEQVKVLTKATDMAEKDYQEQLREYRLGLVNNLQVLQVQANFKASQLALERARYNARVQTARLAAATGEVPK